jgi:HEAT repeat protein
MSDGNGRPAGPPDQPVREGVSVLPPEETARLNEFARACRAAARAVALYPPAHPAIATTIARIVDLTGVDRLSDPLKIGVLPDLLLLDGRAPSRIDQAVRELAVLLHDHLVGEITVHPGGDVEAWRSFLLLLARTADSVRADGGIARLWTTMGGRHLTLREIDYAEVLRERRGVLAAGWERVIASCLEGDVFDMNEDAMRSLSEIAGDPQRLTDVVAALDERAAVHGGIPARTAALIRLLRGIAEAVAETDQTQLDTALRNLSAALGQLSPDMMLELLSHRGSAEEQGEGSPPVLTEIVRRMSDQTIATFVSRSIVKEGTSTDRLAEAFHALVPDHERRHHLIGLAHDETMASPLGQKEGFESLWTNVSSMLTSYSDASFVSDAYGRELSGARTQAIEVERVNDDPPDRLAAWVGTVAPSAVRVLDLTLLMDLLRIEQDARRWHELMRPVVAQIEDLLLVGDFDVASDLVAVVVHEAGPGGNVGRKGAATSAIEQLAGGAMMRHIVSHLATLEEAQFDRVKALCLAIGDMLVRPLAEALSSEERGRTRERLTALLIAFGATGRQTVERLRSSPNPSVRRTAIYLLREFGGNDALPDLAALVDDTEAQVQREAVRAILGIGTDAAYGVLQQALAGGTPQSRDAIMQAIGLVRDERATPLFVYILGHIDHRGPLRPVYLRAIESLGTLRDPEAIEPLKAALYRGEWWAPRRTALLRGAAAAAISRIATPEAREVLREAAASSSRGVRAAVRPVTRTKRASKS